VVTSADPLLGKTYNSVGLSSSQDDVEVCSRRIQFNSIHFIFPCIIYRYKYHRFGNSHTK